jgi:hypothetical protein
MEKDGEACDGARGEGRRPARVQEAEVMGDARMAPEAVGER